MSRRQQTTGKAPIRRIPPDTVDMRQQWRELDEDEAKRWVYFIRSGGEGGPIKIGSSGDPEVRLVDLQVGNPEELTVIGRCRGGKPREVMLHFELQAYWIRGEWYEATAEVLAVIERCVSPDDRWVEEWAEVHGGGIVIRAQQCPKTAEEQAESDAEWLAFLTAWDEEHGVTPRRPSTGE